MESMVNINLARGLRLKQVRLMAGFSRKEFQIKFGISANTLNAWESGRASLTEKGAIKILNAFSEIGLVCSYEWLMDGTGAIPTISENNQIFIKLAITNEKGSAPPSVSYSWLEDGLSITREAEFYKSLSPLNQIFYIVDDGMVPIYEIGDIVGGPKTTQIDKNLENQNCIIEIEPEIVIIRKIHINQDNLTINAYCINPAATVEQPIIYEISPISIAPILWHRRRNPLLNRGDSSSSGNV